MEEKLEKACVVKGAATSLFGVPIKTTSKSLAKSNNN